MNGEQFAEQYAALTPEDQKLVSILIEALATGVDPTREQFWLGKGYGRAEARSAARMVNKTTPYAARTDGAR